MSIVLGIEMSRLARSCKDWHGLLELCALFNTLLYDHDGVYAALQRQVAVGAEGHDVGGRAHGIKNRMEKDERTKPSEERVVSTAPRGSLPCLRVKLVLDPDEQARRRGLLFEKFDQVNTSRVNFYAGCGHTRSSYRCVRTRDRSRASCAGVVRVGRLCWRSCIIRFTLPVVSMGLHTIDPKRKAAGPQQRQKLVPMDQWRCCCATIFPPI